MLLSAPVLIAVGIALNVALWIIAAMFWHMSQPSLFLIAYVGFPVVRGAHRLVRPARRTTANDLQQTNAHLLATRSLLEESARDHERLRLARELHDVAGHKLTALKLNLTALERNGEHGDAMSITVARSWPPSCWTTSAAWSRRCASTTASICARRSRS